MVTTTFNNTATEADKIQAAKHIFETYHTKGGKLETVIHKTNKTNTAWTYSVRLWYVDQSGLVDNLYLNYYLELLGFGKRNPEGYLKGNGGGFERSLQVAYQLGHALSNYGFIAEGYENQGYSIERYCLAN